MQRLFIGAESPISSFMASKEEKRAGVFEQASNYCRTKSTPSPLLCAKGKTKPKTCLYLLFLFFINTFCSTYTCQLSILQNALCEYFLFIHLIYHCIPILNKWWNKNLQMSLAQRPSLCYFADDFHQDIVTKFNIEDNTSIKVF